MRTRSYYLFALCALLSLSSCKKEALQSSLDEQLNEILSRQSPTGQLDYFELPDDGDWEAIPQDVNNPITKDKVLLGKLLFNETGLARNPLDESGLQTYSCASCHHSRAGFQACMPQGIGEGGDGFGLRGEARRMAENYTEAILDVQPIRSPSALNIAYQTNILWNGQFGANGVNKGTESLWPEGTPIAVNELGYDGTETQAIAGLDVHRLVVDESLMDELGYTSMFDKAFSSTPKSERYNNVTAGLAIAAYERTLLANNSPFQRYLRGDYDALSLQQKRGAMLFFGQANCVACHTGPALNTMEFHAIGMKDLSQHSGSIIRRDENAVENLGRGGFTKNDDDKYKFKTPQLYNLKDSPFLGHGASITSVRDIVAYKNKAQKENPNVPDRYLSPLFTPLNLSLEKIDAITTFIQDGLYDPNLSRFDPDELLSGNCFPNADAGTRNDLNCN